MANDATVQQSGEIIEIWDVRDILYNTASGLLSIAAVADNCHALLTHRL
jgi:hypothetical protein